MRRFVLICPEPIRSLQQGVGIRFLEMARELQCLGHVSLWVPNSDFPDGHPFEVRGLPNSDFATQLSGVDVVIVHGYLSEWYFQALLRSSLDYGPPLVVDLYDPYLVENLQYNEQFGDDLYLHDRQVLLGQLRRGDYFLASSDVQRLFYLGIMVGDGSFSPRFYREDRTLRSVIDVVPFGVRAIGEGVLSSVEGKLKGRVKGIGHDDVVLFFGGVYDWYDPELLLDVLDDAVAIEPRLRVIFSCTPSPDTTPQGVFRRLQERAATSSIGKRIFFVPWFPYVERVAYFCDVDLAVSLHHASLETELSLRTRVLEYMNMSIPVISTAGGETGRILQASGGGMMIDVGDRAGLSAGLRHLLQEPTQRRAMGEKGRRWIVERMRWECVLEPLLRFCESPQRLPKTVEIPKNRSPSPVYRPQSTPSMLSTVVRRMFSGGKR